MPKSGLNTVAAAAVKHAAQASHPASYPAYTAGVVAVALILLAVLIVSVTRTINRRVSQ